MITAHADENAPGDLTSKPPLARVDPGEEGPACLGDVLHGATICREASAELRVDFLTQH